MTRRSLLAALGIAPVAAKATATAKSINAPSHAKIMRSVTITSDTGFTVMEYGSVWLFNGDRISVALTGDGPAVTTIHREDDRREIAKVHQWK